MSHSRSGRRPQPTRIIPPTAVFPTTDEIASRAHDLFVAEGRHVTRILEYWQQAERELLDRAARRALAASPAKR